MPTQELLEAAGLDASAAGAAKPVAPMADQGGQQIAELQERLRRTENMLASAREMRARRDIEFEAILATNHDLELQVKFLTAQLQGAAG